MAGASRFWTRKDSDLVSQHVALPLDFIKKSLEEKQLHRDQTEAGIVNDDYKSPNNLEWSKAHTSAVNDYNERKKNERLKIQEQFYNSPIDNTNQVASQLLTNRRKSADEWKEGTGEAYNLQRMYDEYSTNYQNELKRVKDKQALQTDVDKSNIVTQLQFNKEYGDKFNQPLNKINVGYHRTADYVDADKLARDAVKDMKESGRTNINVGGLIVNTDKIKYLPYEEAVKIVSGMLESNNDFKGYRDYRSNTESKLFSLQNKNPENWTKNERVKLIDQLSNRTKDLYEYSSGDDYTNFNRMGLRSQEDYNKALNEYKKNGLAYNKEELNNMSNEDLIKLYTKDQMTSKATGSAASLASFLDEDKKVDFNPLGVQNSAHVFAAEYDKKQAAIKLEEEKRLELQKNRIQDYSEPVDKIPELEGAEDNSLWNKILGGISAVNPLVGEGIRIAGKKNTVNFMGNVMNVVASGLRGKPEINNNGYKNWRESLQKPFNIQEESKDRIDFINKSLTTAENLIQTQIGAVDLFGEKGSLDKDGKYIPSFSAHEKFKDYVKNNKDVQDKSLDQQLNSFVNNGIKELNKFNEANSLNKQYVFSPTNPEYIQNQQDSGLGKKTGEIIEFKGRKLNKFTPGILDSKRHTIKIDGKLYQNQWLSDIVKDVYKCSDNEVENYTTMLKNDTGYTGNASVSNRPIGYTNGKFDQTLGGKAWTTNVGGKQITWFADGTEQQKEYHKEIYPLIHGVGVGKETKPVNVSRLSGGDILELDGKNGKRKITGTIHAKTEYAWRPKDNKSYVITEKPNDPSKYDRVEYTRQYDDAGNALDEVLGFTQQDPESINGKIIHANHLSGTIGSLGDEMNNNINDISDENYSQNALGRVATTSTNNTSINVSNTSSRKQTIPLDNNEQQNNESKP